MRNEKQDKGPGCVQGVVIPDWQVTSILSDKEYIETDCNSGETRRIRKSKCVCGQPVLIEFNAKHTMRTDRKRIFYPDEPDNGGCAFRCKSCTECVHDSVRGAEFSA